MCRCIVCIVLIFLNCLFVCILGVLFMCFVVVGVWV